ncbi:MAG: 50S ribosomal protein L29 [Candidatus Cloacimonetes bacterium]|nr:50S ribosomal protein L29 [Candidatus Cloacimonadota bacterium]
MKMTELRELSNEELEQKLSDFKEEVFNLRFQLGLNQLENPMRLKDVKRDIARIKTLLTERAGTGSTN